jgi:DNA-binding transcriptional LysR family regulator
MDLRQLRYYIVVAEELHFGRAAERLKMTQPALSKQIMVLEKDIGVQLMSRTKRVVQLTHAGQAFLNRARFLLTQSEEMIQVARRTARGEEGQLTLGVTPPATQIVPDLLRGFRNRFPKVELNLSLLTTESQVVALNQRQIDIGFLHPPIDARGLDLYPVHEEDFIAVLPKDHRLLKYEKIPLAQFAGESFIILPRHESPVLYDQFVQFCQKLGFQPNIVKEVLDLQTRLCLIAAGVGISFVSEGLHEAVGANVVCRPLEYCPIKQKLAAAWRQDATAPAIHSFLALMQEQLLEKPTQLG